MKKDMNAYDSSTTKSGEGENSEKLKNLNSQINAYRLKYHKHFTSSVHKKVKELTEKIKKK